MNGKNLKRQMRSKSFRQIANLFIGPLVLNKPKRYSYHQFLSKIFCLKTRTIKQYQVKASFDLSGALQVAPLLVVPGRGHTIIRKDALILVRHDTTMPEKYELEHTCTPGRKPQVFELTLLEWAVIQEYIKPKRFEVSNV